MATGFALLTLTMLMLLLLLLLLLPRLLLLLRLRILHSFGTFASVEHTLGRRPYALVAKPPLLLLTVLLLHYAT